MPQLTRDERAAALTCLLAHDYAGFSRLVRASRNLTQPTKIDMLATSVVLSQAQSDSGDGPNFDLIMGLVSMINKENGRTASPS